MKTYDVKLTEAQVRLLDEAACFHRESCEEAVELYEADDEAGEEEVAAAKQELEICNAAILVLDGVIDEINLEQSPAEPQLDWCPPDCCTHLDKKERGA